jgi:hypothetical protein
MVEQGTQEGSLRAVDPDLAGTVLVASAVGILTVGLLDPYRADWGWVAQEGMRMLLDGLSNDQEGAKARGGP